MTSGTTVKASAKLKMIALTVRNRSLSLALTM